MNEFTSINNKKKLFIGSKKMLNDKLNIVLNDSDLIDIIEKYVNNIYNI